MNFIIAMQKQYRFETEHTINNAIASTIHPSHFANSSRLSSINASSTTLGSKNSSDPIGGKVLRGDPIEVGWDELETEAIGAALGIIVVEVIESPRRPDVEADT
jgi:hypothetical protein